MWRFGAFLRAFWRFERASGVSGLPEQRRRTHQGILTGHFGEQQGWTRQGIIPGHIGKFPVVCISGMFSFLCDLEVRGLDWTCSRYLGTYLLNLLAEASATVSDTKTFWATLFWDVAQFVFVGLRMANHLDRLSVFCNFSTKIPGQQDFL